MKAIRAWLAGRRTRIVLLIVAVAVALLWILPTLPGPVAADGTLEECALMSWPVIQFDDDAWRQALPESARRGAPNSLPVSAWPAGLSYDDVTDTVFDPDGAVRFRRGDRVRITGAVVEVHGDPSPCYYIYNVRIDTIEAIDP